MDKFFKPKGTNKSSTRLGIGGAPTGGHGWGERNDSAAFEGLLAALDNGIYLFDTADCYGLGNAEIILGKAIKESKVNRELLTISTKGGVAWDEQLKIYKDSSPSYIESAVNKSLQRLNVDYIDIYYLHWTDGKTPIEKTFEKLIEIKNTGKIKSLGVSNLSLDEIEKISNIGLSALQVKGNLLEPSDVYKYAPLAEKINASLFTFSTLADGILTGKFDKLTKFDKDDHRNKYPLFQKEKYLLSLKKVNFIKNLSAEYNLTVPQIAIRWMLETKGVDSVLFGSTSKKNVLENIKALDINFDKHLYKSLSKNVPF